MATKNNDYMDTRYSWVIAAACCWVTFVIQGLVRSAGVIYVSLIDTFIVTRGQASWPFTLRMAIWNLSGPVAGALSYKWSIRVITITGILIVTLGNILCYFAPDITAVTIFFGLIQGIGTGMAVTLIPVIINQYFNKYKTSGAGIACAGATAGSFALPPIVKFTIEEYGLKGSFLIMGGITLNGILGASLMRPTTWIKSITNRGRLMKYEKSNILNSNRINRTRILETETCNVINSDENYEIRKKLHLKEYAESLIGHRKYKNQKVDERKSIKTVRFSSDILEVDDNSESLANVIKDIEEKSVLLQKAQMPIILKSNAEIKYMNSIENTENGTSQIMNCDHKQNSPTHSEVNDNDIDNFQLIANYSNVNNDMELQQISQNGYVPHKEISVRKYRHSVLTGLLEPAKASWIVLKNPIFLIIASNYSVFFLSYMTYLIVIVDYSLDLGVDKADSVFLVSTFSIADLAGRLGSGWITDSGLVKRKNLMMFNMITLGVLMVATSFSKFYFALMAVSVTAGLVVGVNLILFYALLDDYLGKRQMAMAVGLMNFFIGCISLVTPFLTGIFRDQLSSYDHLFHFLGALLIACGFLWLFESIQEKCRKNVNQ